MKKEVILLGTTLEAGYWQKRKRATYNYKQLSGLDLSRIRSWIPAPAIAVHFGEKDGCDLADLPFCYFRVNELREEGDRVRFVYQLLAESKSTSSWRSLRTCLQTMPSQIVETREPSEILTCLKRIGEEPPDEWVALLDQAGPEPDTWTDWIGKRFLAVKSQDINPDRLEDTVADIFVALGFQCEQMGHKRKGSFPDGTLICCRQNHFGIVYDCKNKRDYAATEADVRAMKDYMEKEGRSLRAIEVARVYSMAVAHSFNRAAKIGADFCITLDALLYLLYKRFRLGNRMDLHRIQSCADQHEAVDGHTIDREWPG